MRIGGRCGQAARQWHFGTKHKTTHKTTHKTASDRLGTRKCD